ncbi:hypothetical protein JZM20_34125, partial [Escherichia coli]|nr:hypothetical protein [Escherichia coli]
MQSRCPSRLPFVITDGIEFRFARWGSPDKELFVMPRFFARHAATLFFPMALILYDFAAYLSTDLI